MAASKIFLFLVTTKLLMTTLVVGQSPMDAVYESMEKLDETCGFFDTNQQQQSSMGRVVGGVDAPVYPPWMVRVSPRFKKINPNKKESDESDEDDGVGYLTKDDEGKEEQFREATFVGLCGGAVIDQYNILTASHCFEGEWDEKFISVDVDFGGRLFVTDDTWRRSNQKTMGRLEKKMQLHGIDKKNVIVHEDYKNGDINYDIAIIHLPFRIDLAQSPKDKQRVRHVCLPDEHDLKMKLIDTDECYLTGWGRICEKGPNPKALQEAKMPILDDATCKRKLDALNVSYDENHVICAAGNLTTGEPSSCYGDSGGPLVCRKMINYKTKWVLMGLVSRAAGYCGMEEMPIRFARVSAFRRWIIRNKKKSAEIKKEIGRRDTKKFVKIDKKPEKGPPPPIIGGDDDDDNEKKKKPERTSRKPRRRGRRRPRKHRPSESDDEPEPDEDQEPEYEPRPRRKRPAESQYSGGNQIIITNNNLNQNLEDSLSGGETTKQQQQTTEDPRQSETKQDKLKNRNRKNRDSTD